MQETGQAAKRRRERSPSYPGIDLETAIERARVLRAREGRNAAPVDAILHHWGYRPASGMGMVALAALKKFGLLEDQGVGTARKAKLTDLALTILLDEREDSPQRMEAIRSAALRPPIHAELWEESGEQLPSDQNLRYKLRRERGFTDSAADQFIRQFRSTLAFAGLTDSDSMGEYRSDKPSDRNGEYMHAHAPETATGRRVASPTPPPQPSFPSAEHGDPSLRTVSLPLAGAPWATLQVPYPLSEEAWDQMMQLLKAMKVGLVSPGRRAEPADGAGGED